MSDEGKMFYAKRSLNRMIDRLGRGFLIGVVAFNTDAQLIRRFTFDHGIVKDVINDIGVSGTTNYIPSLKKARALLGDKTFDPETMLASDFIIMLSDGLPWDKGMPGTIVEEAEALTDEGVCIFSIGYGSGVERDSEAEKILKRIADISVRKLDCGGYLYSTPSDTDLDRIFSDIYSDISDEGDLILRPRINTQMFSDEDLLTIFSRVYSSYNTLSLPFDDPQYCPINLQMRVNALDDKRRSIIEYPMEYAPYLGYHLVAKELDSETEIIKIDSTILDKSDQSCEVTGTRSIPVRFSESSGGTTGTKFYLQLSSIIVNLFLILFMGFLLIFILTQKNGGKPNE
jgi:hypothetical protein